MRKRYVKLKQLRGKQNLNNTAANYSTEMPTTQAKQLSNHNFSLITSSLLIISISFRHKLAISQILSSINFMLSSWPTGLN